MPQLRDYQDLIVTNVHREWEDLAERLYGGKRLGNVLAVAPTGAGKTVIFSHEMAAEPGASVAIAHRQELVSQISLALARNGVRHRVIGPDTVQRNCAALHCAELGRSFVDAGARAAVAGVQTLIRRDAATDPWFAQVRLVVMDEGHHVLLDNSWGKACAMFPNARILLVTATPGRADGKGLGRHASGIVDCMVEGPTMRTLINRGFLTEYRPFAPPTRDLDLSQVTIGASGDFSQAGVRAAVHKSAKIIGNVVGHYKDAAWGKLGVTFAVDVESATDLVRAYRAEGIPAELVTAETPDLLRAKILRDFRNRNVLQLVNVDLFGEGFDLPAIEVVSMARPTQSFALYAQQFGRALRLMEGKERAIILDHVGNIERHGLPDAPRKHSLDDRDRRASSGPSDTQPTRTCLNCTSSYPAVKSACPYCKTVHVPQGRSTPAQVDGVLRELDPAVMAQMRGELAKMEAAPAYHPDPKFNGRNQRAHWEWQQAQQRLRKAMTVWAGWKTNHEGMDDDEAQRTFFFRYRIDIHNAWCLDTKEAEKLSGWIEADLAANNIVEAA